MSILNLRNLCCKISHALVYNENSCFESNFCIVKMLKDLHNNAQRRCKIENTAKCFSLSFICHYEFIMSETLLILKNKTRNTLKFHIHVCMCTYVWYICTKFSNVIKFCLTRETVLLIKEKNLQRSFQRVIIFIF